MIRKTLLVILLLIPTVAAAIVTKMNAVPRRFSEIEPGAVYRGARPTPEQIRILAQERNIHTIISLLESKSTPVENERMQAARDARVRVLRFPMPGDGTGEFGVLDRAADAVSDPANRPLYFHCAAGKQRSNAVLAAYRMKHCGWTLDQALQELTDRYDLEREGSEQKLVEHLTRYSKWLGLTSGTDNVTPAPMPAGPRRE